LGAGLGRAVHRLLPLPEPAWLSDSGGIQVITAMCSYLLGPYRNLKAPGARANNDIDDHEWAGRVGFTREGSSGGAEDQGAGWYPWPGRDKHMLDPGDLVHRSPPKLAHSLGQPIHAMDVGLAELSSVGVDRKFAT
jgi:hypothetical protein